MKDSNKNNALPSFKQQEIFINSKKSPAISQTFDGKELVPICQHCAAFREIVALFGNANSVDWTYTNGRKAQTIVVPQVKDKDSFMKQSIRLRWVESMLEHPVGGVQENDKEDTAE